MIETKTCRDCGENKPEDQFYYKPKGRVGTCRACQNLKVAEWKRRNPERVRAIKAKFYRNHVKYWRRRAVVEDWPAQLLRNAVNSSKRRKQGPPTITVAWIVAQPMVCPYLGIPLEPSEQIRGLRQPSLDRIDNSKGYTPENTRLTSLAWNQMRNMSSVEDALHLVADIRLTVLLREVA